MLVIYKARFLVIIEVRVLEHLFVDITEQALQRTSDLVQSCAASLWRVCSGVLLHRFVIIVILHDNKRANNMTHLLKATQVLGRWRKPKLSLRKQQTLLKQAITPRNAEQILEGKVELSDTAKAVLTPLLTTYVAKWEGRYNGEVKEFRAPKGHKFEKKLLERYV